MKPFDGYAGGEAVRPTVVLLHSSGSSSRQWNALAEWLSPRFDVRTVDFHGHGTRPAWRGARPLALADEAALVAPILREAGRVHLVGHSYGGAVALKVAAMFPHSVRSVVTYEPVLFRWLFDDDPNTGAAREVIAAAAAVAKYLYRGDAYRAAERFLNYWGGVGSWESLPTERRDAMAGRMRSVLAHFDALFGEVLPASALRRARVPMLFLSGAQTVASARRISALLRAALPTSVHEGLAGMGHLGPITHAPGFNRRVLAFLERDPALHDIEAIRLAA